MERKEYFNQVCVWPGVTLGNLENGFSPQEFEQVLAEEFEGVRVHYLETIFTLLDKNELGEEIPNTGGRSDIFFAVHDEDIMKFAILRLQAGIRWIEDAVSEINNPNGIVYPERVLEYKNW
jgi:hypothetical protein